jgi:hypothetical protein
MRALPISFLARIRSGARAYSGRLGNERSPSYTGCSIATPNSPPRPKQTYANCADSDIASAISRISGVGVKPSSAGARIARASATRPVDW